MILTFSLRATSEAALWQSWIDAGICMAPHVYTSEYPGIEVYGQTEHGWQPTRATGNTIIDAFGNEVSERVPVSGWHANVRVVNPALIAEMTYGLSQTNADGSLKDIFDRTWATHVFQLTWQEADPVSGFPAGYRNAAGTVSYCDPSAFKSATNVFAT